MPKAAPKARRRGKKTAPTPVTVELLKTIPFFEGLENSQLERLLVNSKHLEFARSEHVIDAKPSENANEVLYLVLFGDVSVHRTQIKGAEETFNYLSVGDFFLERLVVDEDTRKLRLTAMCPARVLQMNYADLNALISAVLSLKSQFYDSIRRVVERQKTRFDDKFQKDIARFLVQERLTFAGRVKLKRMDLCIECDGCYAACKSRHGTDRLGPSEVKFGLTEVPQNCHNCVVPECMDKCKFGHIGRHPVTKEIVIDDNCIGCTMCSKGCSFGSIRMHPITDLDIPKYFPNRAPDAKGKAIAQKCDNCTNYADKACIQACPTGALFQIDGAELFDNWRLIAAAEQEGGYAPSPIEQPYGWRQFWLLMTVLVTLILTWECFGRLFWPELTFTETFYRFGWLEEGVDRLVPFRAGDPFGHALGYIAAGMVIGTQVYRLRGRLASTPVLMEAHIWLGVMGAIVAFFHTAFVFSDPIALATFGTMMLAVVTGMIGRYVVYIVPRNRLGHQMHLDEVNIRIKDVTQAIENAFQDPNMGHTAIVRLQDIVGREKTESEGDQPVSRDWKQFFRHLVELLRRDARTRRRVSALMTEMGEGLKTDEKRALIEKMMTEKSRLERAIVHHETLARVLKRYRIVHVTSSNIMFGALVLHVIFALMYQVN